MSNVSRLPVEVPIKLTRAAAYVRMSTEHQQYSIDNQLDKIREYADEHSIGVVKVYEDPGKSGLRIDGRPGLQQLLRDVVNGEFDYSQILVYDVSRWGRFLDTDESAYYEFLCRRAGLNVTYCAERFENDLSPFSTLVKSIKRLMAAEYSRDLSARVARGKIKGANFGRFQGGPANFGLRRALVDDQGRVVQTLQLGKRNRDRDYYSILIPGPQKEVKIVQKIFRWYAEEHIPSREIAKKLNKVGARGLYGRPWSSATVLSVITSECYVGNYIYNRSSRILGAPITLNPPALWVRKDALFEGIIPEELFKRAQLLRRQRKQATDYKNDEEILESLRRLHKKVGKLTCSALAAAKDTCAVFTIYKHFGSLGRAIELAGLPPPANYAYSDLKKRIGPWTLKIVEELRGRIHSLGGTSEFNVGSRTLTVNSRLQAHFQLCRRRAYRELNWEVDLPELPLPNLIIAGRLDASGKEILDFFAIPGQEIKCANLYISACEHGKYSRFRIKTIDGLAEMLLAESASKAY